MEKQATLILIVLAALALVLNFKFEKTAVPATVGQIPDEGIVLVSEIGDLGRRLVEAGVIDEKKFPGKEILNQTGELKINRANAGAVLNLLWAFGLANKNEILEKGPMSDPQYGGAGGFASTGGWTIAKGDVMEHYSKHIFVVLTPEQQKLVKAVSKNIYRPCCNNPTHFPDCNHGMAMLGLLELLAAQGADEKIIYEAALTANSYWFPGTYLTIAKYWESKNIDRKTIFPETILGPEFSSASGYRQILSQVNPVTEQSGGSCTF